MERFLFTIDRVSEWFGKAFAWCILVVAFGVCYEILVRKLLNAPTVWAFDLSYIMYGSLFMMAGAYALSRNAHVRGDVFFRLLKPRKQAVIELTLYIILFFPGVFAITAVGLSHAGQTWGYNAGMGEFSNFSPAPIPLSAFKTILPIAGGLLVLQGVAEVLRCIVCLRDGQWPTRLHDVEELENVLLAQSQNAEKENAAKA